MSKEKSENLFEMLLLDNQVLLRGDMNEAEGIKNMNFQPAVIRDFSSVMKLPNKVINNYIEYINRVYIGITNINMLLIIEAKGAKLRV